MCDYRSSHASTGTSVVSALRHEKKNRYSIFAEAAAEVLEVLLEKCEVAFKTSPAYEFLLMKAEQDEAEMAALDKVR